MKIIPLPLCSSVNYSCAYCLSRPFPLAKVPIGTGEKLMPQTADLLIVRHHLGLQLIGELQVDPVVAPCYAAAMHCLTVPYVFDPRLPAPLTCYRISHLIIAVGLGGLKIDLPYDQALDLTAHLHGHVPVARHRQPGPDLDAGDKRKLLAQYCRIPYPLLGRLPDPRVERVGRSADAGEPVQHLLERQQPRDVCHHHPAQTLGQKASHLAAARPAAQTFALVAVGDDDHLPVEDEDVLRQLLDVTVLQRCYLGTPSGLSSPDVCCRIHLCSE